MKALKLIPILILLTACETTETRDSFCKLYQPVVFSTCAGRMQLQRDKDKAVEPIINNKVMFQVKCGKHFESVKCEK